MPSLREAVSIRRCRLSFISAALAAVLIAGSGQAARARDQLTIGLSQFPSNFHPSYERTLAKRYVLAMSRRPVTAYDAAWRLVCLACVEVPSLEGGTARLEPRPDGKTGMAVTYRLRHDLFWGDGTPVTTDDVLFTWQLSREPGSGTTDADVFADIAGIEAVDEKTFIVHRLRPRADYARLPLEILPAHIEAAKAAEPGAYRQRSAYESDPTNPGLYFGPYRVAHVERGSHIVLEANRTWRGPKPAFARVVVRTIENTPALVASLLAGQVDMIAGEAGLSLDQAIELEQRRAGFVIDYRQGLLYEHIDLNLDDPAFADLRVRQALLHGLDRKALSDTLFAGRQPVAHANVSPLDPVYAEARTYEYDPARAAELLDAAGWRRGSDGIRRNTAGQALSFELLTTAGDRSRALVQQFLQEQWRRIGIDARLRTEPPRVFFDTLRNLRFQAAILAWTGSPSTVPMSTLHSGQVPSAENGLAGQNVSGYRNPRMDALLEAAAAEIDPGRRQAAWRALQGLYVEELPALPLFFRVEAHVQPRWLKGVAPTGHQDVTTLWIEQWRSE